MRFIMAKRGRPRKNPIAVVVEKTDEPCGLDALFETRIADKKGAEKVAIVNSEIKHENVEVPCGAIVKVHYLCVAEGCPSTLRGFDCYTDSVATICPFCKGDRLIIDSVTALKEKVRLVQ
jgi:hypothetical protein